MESMLLDAAGHRRSPATMPGYHRGRPPRNKGEQYPADLPTVEEIVAVMRAVGDRPDGQRLRALIMLLWRAGLRIKRSPSRRAIWTAAAAPWSCGAGRAVSDAKSGWTDGRGSSWNHGSRSVAHFQSPQSSA